MTPYSALIPLVALELPGAPDPLIEDAIRRTVIMFCEQSRALTRFVDASVTANDGRVVLAPPAETVVFEATRPAIWLPTGRRVFARSKQQLDAARPEWEAEKGQAPIFYFLAGMDVARIVPMIEVDEPNALRLELVLRPTRASASFDDELNEGYQDALVAGAKSILQAIPGKDWTNIAASAYNANVFADGVSTARTRRFRSGTDAPLHAQPVSFITGC